MSLVVAVGNPSKLLSIEEHMVSMYGEKARCWSNFLNQCLLNDTFIVPDCVAPAPQDKEYLKNGLRVRVQKLLGINETAVSPRDVPPKPDHGGRILPSDHKTTDMKPSRTSPRQKKRPNSKVDKQKENVFSTPTVVPSVSVTNKPSPSLPLLIPAQPTLLKANVTPFKQPLLDTSSLVLTSPAHSKAVVKPPLTVELESPTKFKAKQSPSIATYSGQEPGRETPIPAPKSSSPQTVKKKARKRKQQQLQGAAVTEAKTTGQVRTQSSTSKPLLPDSGSQTKIPNCKLICKPIVIHNVMLTSECC